MKNERFKKTLPLATSLLITIIVMILSLINWSHSSIFSSIQTSTPTLQITLMKTPTKTPPPQTNEDIYRLKHEMSLIENRIDIIENLLINNPEQAVSLVLMKKDIDYIKQDISRLNDRINRSNSVSIALAVGLFIFLATHIYSIFEKEKNSQNNDGEQTNN